MDKYEGGCVEKGSRSKCYLPKLQTLTKREDPMDNQYRYDLVDFLEDPSSGGANGRLAAEKARNS